MLKRFINLFKQDLKLALRNGFLYAVLFLSVLIIAVINFAVPKTLKLSPSEIFLDLSQGKVLEKHLAAFKIDKSRFFETRADLKKEVGTNSRAIGIVMEGTLEDARFTVVHQGTESKEIINVLDATIEGTLNEMRGLKRPTYYQIDYLRSIAAPIPFNKSLVPVMMVFEVVMFGFILAAVMIFQEKQEGSIRAYRVSPTGVLEYILSKVMVNVIFGLIYGVLIVVFTLGKKVNYPVLLLIISLTSFLMTLIGLLISVFFNNISEFIFVGLGILLIVSMPMVSYLMPTFAPKYLTLIPSYPVVFGLREILFPTGKRGIIGSMSITLIIEIAAILIVTRWVAGKRLMGEGR